MTLLGCRTLPLIDISWCDALLSRHAISYALPVTVTLCENKDIFFHCLCPSRCCRPHFVWCLSCFSSLSWQALLIAPATRRTQVTNRSRRMLLRLNFTPAWRLAWVTGMQRILWTSDSMLKKKEEPSLWSRINTTLKHITTSPWMKLTICIWTTAGALPGEFNLKC